MPALNDLTMPKLGLTMTEGVLSSWEVAPGQAVRAGQVLFVVETDKLATDVEAASDGEIIELVVGAGATAQVGDVVARWTGRASAPVNDDAPPEAAPAPSMSSAPVAATPAPSEPPPSAPEAGRRIAATPLARRLARMQGIDLSAVVGTGARGQIRARDIPAAGPPPEPAAAPEPIRAAAAPAAPPPAPRPVTPGRTPATPLQATVARRLVQAKRDIPHFYLSTEAEVGAAMALRATLNADGAHAKLTLNHFVLAAVARVWSERPEANRVWEEDGFVIPAGVDLGLAVDTPRGLLAPVMRDAGALPLDALAAAADALAARARDGKLGAEDLTGGAVTVSNVGAAGPTYLTPIVNPGQSAILGVGAVRELFRPDAEGRPALRRELGLVLACDHRVFDGVAASRLLGAVVDLIEHPLRLLRPAPQRKPG